MNLTTVGLLASHLTNENYREVLEAARHKSKRQVEELVARLHPRPDFPSSIRKLPTIVDAGAAVTLSVRSEAAISQPIDEGQCTSSREAPCSTPSRPPTASLVPLAPERYKVQFTASAETLEKLRLVQNLLRHQIPDGNPAAIFDRALTALLESLSKEKLAATDRPRNSRGTAIHSRHIPAEVLRAVWHRDGGRCAFVSRNGRRCAEEGFLEFHHVKAYAVGRRVLDRQHRAPLPRA